MIDFHNNYTMTNPNGGLQQLRRWEGLSIQERNELFLVSVIGLDFSSGVIINPLNRQKISIFSDKFNELLDSFNETATEEMGNTMTEFLSLNPDLIGHSEFIQRRRVTEERIPPENRARIMTMRDIVRSPMPQGIQLTGHSSASAQRISGRGIGI
jgi:hypothetical protein